jgi:hypothetical protein
VSNALTHKVALGRIVCAGVEPVLLPAGFRKVGSLSWVRVEAELHHVIVLLGRRGMYDVQWSVVCPEAAAILWGRESILGDVGEAVMSGTPSTIRHPAAGQYFRLEDANDASSIEQIASSLLRDMRVVEERLRVFTTRRELRTCLVLNRDEKDRRDFVIPANLPLNLFIAASLAFLDADPAACDLVVEAEKAMSRYHDELSLARLSRLRSAAANLCG